MKNQYMEENLDELETILQNLQETPTSRRLFLASIPLILSACAAPVKTRYREGDNIGQDISITVEDEERMTREVLPEMQKDYPPLKDSLMQGYIRDLGQNITQKNHLAKNPYTYSFTVVDVPQVNAFALPAGTIFVTTPLIAMTESEAELAGVIGHEVGHVQARHAAERIDAMERSSRRNLLTTIGAGVLGAAAGYGLGRTLCRPNDRTCIQRAIELGAITGAGGAFLVQKYRFMANSREDEMEADRISFRTGVRAGYAPMHVGRFYDRLLEMETQRGQGGSHFLRSLEDAMSTHPPSHERVAQMRKLVKETKNPHHGAVTNENFKKIRSRAKEITKRYQS